MRLEIRHTVVLGLGTGVSAVLALVYTIYVSRKLGPELTSHFVGAMALIAWCQVALGPINGTIARFTSRYASDGRLGQVRTLHREVLIRVLWYGLPLIVVALVISPALRSLLRFPTVWPIVIAAVTVYVTLALSVSRGVLRGIEHFGSLNVNVVVEASARLIFGVAILAITRSVEAALLASLLALVVTVVLAQQQTATCWRDYPAEPVVGAEVKKFALPMFVLMFTAAGYQNIDMLFVKRFLSEQAAGEYGAAFSLARSISVAVTPVAIVLLPALSRLYEKGESIFGALIRFCSYFLLLASVPVLAFAIWPTQIMSLFGSEFTGATQYLVPVSLLRVVGFLAQLIALGGAASNRFTFLYPFVAGMLGAFAALCLYHDSGVEIVWINLVAQVVALAAMIVVLCKPAKPSVR